MKLTLSNSANKILFLLIATDFIYICFHIFYKLLEHKIINLGDRVSLNELFFLYNDRSYSEFFQYAKEYWIAILFSLIAWRNKSFLYKIWSLLFTYLLLDDFFLIHEKAGLFIGERLNFISILNLRPVDFGEIVFSICIGSFFFIFIAIAYKFSNKINKKICKSLINLLLALAFFGIVTDLIHAMAWNKFIEEILSVIEDGGEQIVMSVMTAFVYFISEHTKQMYIDRTEKVTEMLVKN